MDGYITVAKAHERTGYDKEYLRSLIRDEKIDAKKIGSQWMIDEESLAKWVASHPRQ